MNDLQMFLKGLIRHQEEKTDLNGVASFRSGSLKADDDLKLFRLEVFWREFVERRSTVDLVSDNKWEDIN